MNLFTAGDLDRRITFQRRTATTDPVYGTKTYTWPDVATVYAQVRDVLPSRAENVADGLSLQRRPCRIRVRYREDIDGTMRVKHGARTMRIVSGPVELGRRFGLEMVCEDWSTEGQEP